MVVWVYRVSWRCVLVSLVVFGLFGSVLAGPVAGQVSAPSEGEQIDEVWVFVDGTITVDISSAFAGTVDTYGAYSQQSSTATATLDGSVVTVTGVAAGTTSIQLSARNTAGTGWGYFQVTVVEDDDAPVVRCCFGHQRPTAGGAAATWDTSQRFMGPVDSYAVTVDRSFPTGGGDDPVLRASVTDSTITVTPLRQGFALLTVSATNTNGTSTLGLAVRVDEATTPPTTTTTTVATAPAASGTLAGQTVTVGNSEDVDVAGGFTGTIDTYTATSSDETKVTVSMSGSVVTLSGVAPGSATVTVTATNTAGTATQTIAVTVEALAAPELGAALTAQTVAVGDSADVDVTAGFAGTVDSYGAVSSDETVATVSVDGATVTVTGVAAGTATVSVTATNATGSVSQSFTVTVSDLVVTATAPTYCLTGEGRPVIVTPGTTAAAASSRTTTPPTTTVGREGVATVDVSYTISGGRGPYTVTIPDATPAGAGTGGTSAARAAAPGPGVMAVSCALPGVNLDNVAASANVVEAGPKTIRLQVTDATGATTTTEVTIQVAEDAYTTEYNGGIMRAGRTYVLGDPDAWTLITVPNTLDLRFAGLSMGKIAYFVDTVTGSTITLNWPTGAEMSRDIATPASPDGGTTSRNVGSLFDNLIASALRPTGVTYSRVATRTSWRPYPGLPADTIVKVHPRVVEGKTINVCNSTKTTDFSTSTDKTAFDRSFDAAFRAWNDTFSMLNNNTAGTPHTIFSKSCDTSDPYLVIVRKARMRGDYSCDARWGCADYPIIGTSPPTITWVDKDGLAGSNRITIVTDETDEFRWVLTHELGHFLGLGDYKGSLVSTTNPCPVSLTSLYTFGDEHCHSETITTRDENDLHAIYHPDDLVGLRVEQSGGEWEIHGRMPYDSGRLTGPPEHRIRAYEFEYNAYRVVVWARSASLGSSYSFLGALGMDRGALAGGQVRIKLNDLICGKIHDCHSDYDARGKVFLVAGVTRGDWKRDTSQAAWTAHSARSILALGSGEWTLGDPEEVSGPPSPVPVPRPPSVLRITASRLNVTEAPGAGRSADITATFDSAAVGADARVEFTVTPQGGATSSDFVVSRAGSAAARALWAVAVPVGQLSAALEVAAVDDSDDDGGESLEITARASGGGIVGTLTSEPVTVRIDDNDFTVEIIGDGACETGELVSLSASAPDAFGTVDYRWSGAISGVGSPIGFTCPAAGTHTVTVVGTDDAEGTGQDTHTLIASAPLPPPLPPLPAVPGVPSGLRVTSATTSGGAASVSLAWDAEDGATSYLVGYVGGGSSRRTAATSYTFSGSSEWTEYSFAVRAENAAGLSAWSPLVRKLTPERVSGQVAVVRMTPTSTGYDLSFAFRPSGAGRIEPALRFLRYTELDPSWWLNTSDAVRTSQTPSQILGQVTVSREAAGKVLVCFVPNGASRFCPSTHKLNYANAVVNRWYYSSSFYFTVTDADAARSAARAVEGSGTAHALPAGEALPEWDTIEGRLEDDGLDGGEP